MRFTGGYFMFLQVKQICRKNDGVKMKILKKCLSSILEGIFVVNKLFIVFCGTKHKAGSG